MPMLIEVRRKIFTDKSTIGEMYLDNALECSTLEDTYRKDAAKIYGRTAIPEGRYEVVINWSDRFKRPMPLLLNVPGFGGIRIHSGNTAEQTNGCILLGHFDDDQPNIVSDSRIAFSAFFQKLETALKTSKVFLEVSA